MNQCAVIILPIPPHIPMPRFRLFKSVQFEGNSGEVIGLQYIAESAYIETGWHYAVKVETGAAVRFMPLEMVSESRLELE